jgi:protein-S-isoprenylcysteine O-methyltransferase Ste14
MSERGRELEGPGGAGDAALRLTPALAFLLPALEMVFMASPFAAYFYGAYSPLLAWTRTNFNLIWLGDFFVPHLTRPSSVVLRTMFAAPHYLLYVGLASFAVHAGHLYWTKLVRKSVAQGLLYRYVRHPQYSSLAVAGLGLAFQWPRFINLALYLVMLAAYVALARHEESRVERRHGDAYRAYRHSTGAFLPRLVEARLARMLSWLPANPVGRAAVLAAALALAFSTSFGLRALAVRGLDSEVVPGSRPGLVLFLEDPSDHDRSSLLEAVSTLMPTSARGTVPLFYAVRTKDALDHLLIDSGLSYSRLKQLGIPAGDWYLVQAAASYPCSTGCKVMTDASEALGARALRTPLRLYAVGSNSRRGGVEPYELPADALYGHAAMPSL